MNNNDTYLDGAAEYESNEQDLHDDFNDDMVRVGSKPRFSIVRCGGSYHEYGDSESTRSQSWSGFCVFDRINDAIVAHVMHSAQQCVKALQLARKAHGVH